MPIFSKGIGIEKGKNYIQIITLQQFQMMSEKGMQLWHEMSGEKREAECTELWKQHALGDKNQDRFLVVLPRGGGVGVLGGL